MDRYKKWLAGLLVFALTFASVYTGNMTTVQAATTTKSTTIKISVADGTTAPESYGVDYELVENDKAHTPVSGGPKGCVTASEGQQVNFTDVNDTYLVKITVNSAGLGVRLAGNDVTNDDWTSGKYIALTDLSGEYNFELFQNNNQGGQAGICTIDFSAGTVSESDASVSYTVGGSNVTLTLPTGVTIGADKIATIRENMEFALSNFDSNTMEVKLSGANNFSTTLTVGADGTTSLSAREGGVGLPNGTMTFSVVAKNPGGGSSGDQETLAVQMTVVNDNGYMLGDLTVDGVRVENSSVKVGKSDTHQIKITPGLTYKLLEVAINDQQMSLTGEGVSVDPLTGAITFTAAPANGGYKIEAVFGTDGTHTLIWEYGDGSGTSTDATVTHGKIEIVSAENGNDIIDLTENPEEGGHFIIKKDAVVTVRLIPDYGYQLLTTSLNGGAAQTLTVAAGTEISTFTFTMPDTNLHLGAMFTQVPDKVTTASTQVGEGTIANGGNVINSGSLELDVKDMDPSGAGLTEEQKAAIDAIKAGKGDSTVHLYLDMELNQVINKGNSTDKWENKLEELSDTITVTLKLKENEDNEDLREKAKNGEVYVIREHKGQISTIPAVYNEADNTISFETNKFSEYALASASGFKNVTNSGNNYGGAFLDNTSDELQDKVLNNADDTLLTNGNAAKVWLNVKSKAEEELNAEDVSMVASNKGTSVLGMYLDITLYKQVAAGSATTVSETEGSVTVSLQLPDSLINTNSSMTRTYQIVRVHDTGSGKVVDVLPCRFNAATKTLSFDTDKFSTYALVYKDTPVVSSTSGSSSSSSVKSNPVQKVAAPTGDSTPVGMYVILLLASAAVLVYLGRKKFKESK